MNSYSIYKCFILTTVLCCTS